MQDRMDRILERLSERINEWEGASVEASEAETNFKSYEAATKKAYLDDGQSAAKAEVLRAEKLKKQIMLGQLAFDAERTKQANLRRVV